VNESLPTRAFREHSDLAQLKRQAKDLLDAFRAGEPHATDEVNAHYHDADADIFALHDAQLVIARAYGFASWPKLKAFVDGATAKRLVSAVRSGDIAQVATMLRSRPELVNTDMGGDEHRAIHYAVLTHSPEMTRLLMQHGADARKGIYPHREATAALTLAVERGYDDIVAIIRAEEDRRRVALAGTNASAMAEALCSSEAWRSGRAPDLLLTDPSLAQSTQADGWTPLHVAAGVLDEKGVTWLLEHGADPNRLVSDHWAPLDVAASGARWGETGNFAKFERVARRLLSRGAQLTAMAAVALGEVEWVRDHPSEVTRARATISEDLMDERGLVSVAVWHKRPEMLSLLLDLGFDPNERVRVAAMDEVVYSAGGPLYFCVTTRNRQLAELLLAKGADPNASVYTAGSPLFRAYADKDSTFIKLLESHGGRLDAISAGFSCQTAHARQLLADEAAGRLRADSVSPGSTVAEDLVWTAAGGGDPEIVRMALERIDWPRDDTRWLWPLWQAFTCNGGIDRGLACFRLLLDRADPNVTDGRTILHTVVARGGPKQRAFAELLLDRGARVDIRDELLESTALGWACRWGHTHFVTLLLARGADPVEADAPAWATPVAWAQRMNRRDILELLRTARAE
jgi:ankyrin repeat protein